jgi:hypothetical protein
MTEIRLNVIRYRYQLGLGAHIDNHVARANCKATREEALEAVLKHLVYAIRHVFPRQSDRRYMRCPLKHLVYSFFHP